MVNNLIYVDRFLPSSEKWAECFSHKSRIEDLFQVAGLGSESPEGLRWFLIGCHSTSGLSRTFPCLLPHPSSPPSLLAIHNLLPSLWGIWCRNKSARGLRNFEELQSLSSQGTARSSSSMSRDALLLLPPPRTGTASLSTERSVSVKNKGLSP